MNENNTFEREPLPVFEAPQEAYAPMTQQNTEAENTIRELADSAFAKGLAATIISPLPIASLIAVILSAIGLKAVSRARELAAAHNLSAGGKSVAGKVLSIVGLVTGLVFTAIWGFYFLAIVALVVGKLNY